MQVWGSDELDGLELEAYKAEGCSGASRLAQRQSGAACRGQCRIGGSGIKVWQCILSVYFGASLRSGDQVMLGACRDRTALNSSKGPPSLRSWLPSPSAPPASSLALGVHVPAIPATPVALSSSSPNEELLFQAST